MTQCKHDHTFAGVNFNLKNEHVLPQTHTQAIGRLTSATLCKFGGCQAILVCGDKKQSLLMTLPAFELGFDKPINTEGDVTFSKSFEEIPDVVFFAVTDQMHIKKLPNVFYKIGVLRSLNGNL